MYRAQQEEEIDEAYAKASVAIDELYKGKVKILPGQEEEEELEALEAEKEALEAAEGETAEGTETAEAAQTEAE